MEVRRAARFGGAVLLVAFALAYATWRPRSPGPIFGDFAAYYAGGRSWLAGIDPYGTGIWAIERWLPSERPDTLAVLPFVGPPASLPLWGALGALPYRSAEIVWGCVLAFGAIVLLTLPTLAAGGTIRPARALPLLLLSAAFGPLIDGFAIGQPAIPAAAAAVAAMYFAARGRWVSAATAAFAVALLKPNLALPLIATVRGPRSWTAYGGAAVAWLALNVAVAGGPHGALRYLGVLSAQTHAEAAFAYQYTVTAIASGFGATQHLAGILATVVPFAIVELATVAIVLTRAGIVDAGAIACAAWAFVSPYVHEPDFVIVLFPILVLAQRARGWRWLLGAAGAALVACDPLGLAEGAPGIALSGVSATVTAAQLVSLPSLVRARFLVLPVAVGGALLLLGSFAPREHLGMWPASLPAHFTTSLDGSASTVWHAEVAAAGLLRPHPWSAFLRLLSLGGLMMLLGAAIAGAAVRRPRQGAPSPPAKGSVPPARSENGGAAMVLARRLLGPLLLVLLLAPLRAGTQELPTIHVAGPPIDDYKPVYYGIQSGLFKKYGLNVEATNTQSGSAALAAVVGGSMQVAFTSLPAVLQAHVRGVAFKVVAPAQWYLSDAPTAMLIVKKDGPVHSARDLNNKTIATSSLRDLNQTASLAWVDANGGDSKTIKMIELPSSAIAAAIDDGRVDAATVADPFLSAAVNSGKARVLAHSYDAIGKRFETSVYVSMDDYVQSHQDAMQRFARAMHDAIVYTNTHLPDTVNLVASYSGVEPAVVAKTIRAIDPEFIDPRNLQPMIDIGVKYGLIDHAFDANDLIASTALRAAR